MGLELTVCLPLKLVNGDNAREHWAIKHRRAQKQRGQVRLVLAELRRWPPELPVEVTLTRIGWNAMDAHDGLRSAFKPVVDGIADAMGLDTDADPRVTWKYEQRVSRKGYGVEIVVRELG